MIAKEIDILLAEDNEDHVFLTKKAISDVKNGMSYRLHVVSDGEEALNYVRGAGKYRDEPRPDLILLDIKMPKKSGLEVLKELKGDPKYRTIPVIMLTSSSDEGDVLRSYGMGSNSYITKPTNFEEFVEKIKSIPMCWCRITTLPPKNHRWKNEWSNANIIS